MQYKISRRTLFPLLGVVPGVALEQVAYGTPSPAATVFRQAKATPEASAIAPVDPRVAALLVMDYQDAWLQTLPDPDAVVAQAATAIAVARDHGVTVAFARVAFSAADYAAVPDHNVIFNQIARPAGVLDEDLPRTAIDERLTPEPTDKVVTKTRVSAFDRTDLDAWLRDMGIDTVILAGISTSGVVLSTVCDAADLDYRIFVLADACADRDPAIQAVLMDKVFPQRAQVVTVADLNALFMPS